MSLSHTQRIETSKELADLMVKSDKVLEIFYRRSVTCTVLVLIAVSGLIFDLLFLSLDSTIGSLLYYFSLVSLLGVLSTYMFFYFQYTHHNLHIINKTREVKAKLDDQKMLNELKEKIKKRIERMKGEATYFTSLVDSNEFEKMDKNRAPERGNEEFEYFVRKFFEKMGFRLERSAVVTESGILMQMLKGDNRYLIFPIHPPAAVDEERLKEINRELLSSNAANAVVITAGYFTEEAREYVAKRESVLLYDKKMIAEALMGIVSALRIRIKDETKLLSESDTGRLIRAVTLDKSPTADDEI